MSYHILPWTFEEIGKNLGKSLEVRLYCHVTPGSLGSYWEPPEPAEVEFSAVTIVELLNADSKIVLDSSWDKFLDEVALDLAEQNRERLEEALLEQIGDLEDAEKEAYYDQKRDELRGC